MSAPMLPRIAEGMCRWCDDVADANCPTCHCGKHARWSVCDRPDWDEEIVYAIVCNAHLAAALNRMDWSTDSVTVYDIGGAA